MPSDAQARIEKLAERIAREAMLPSSIANLLREEVKGLLMALEFIAHGHTIPGWRGSDADPLVALAQEVIHGAQETARAELAKWKDGGA